LPTTTKGYRVRGAFLFNGNSQLFNSNYTFWIGTVYLKTTLVEAAYAASRAKGTYLRDKFYRLKPRRGNKRAAIAIAHKILVAIYHMLSQQVFYNDLGDLYLDKLNKNHLTRNLVHRLQRLGYSVTLTLQETPS